MDRYLQMLGDTDPDWEWSCSIGRGVNALLQPYCHALQERRCQARPTTLLSYFKKNSEEPPIDPLNPDDQQTGHPLVSNAYVFIFYYRINMI
jgi:hypothetical protein